MDLMLPELKILENPVTDIILFAVILLVGLLFKRFGANVLSRQSFKMVKAFSHNQFSEVFVDLLKRPIEQLLFLLIIYFAFDRLSFPESWHLRPASEYGVRWFILMVWQLLFFTSIARVLLRLTDFFTFVLINRAESPVSAELANFLKELIKVVLVILCIFTGLRIIYHVNITALVASLGIGGLAVALAAQDTLGNLLGSFIIYLDKPFKAGDHVTTNDIDGIIEHVGFRTTRIRTPEKSLLTVPNKKLIDTPLNNITLSEGKRVQLDLGLTYSTTSAQIVAIMEDIKAVLKDHPQIMPEPTVRFTAFEVSALNIMVVYFVNGNDGALMLTVKEEINLKIMGIIEANGSAFAFPTRTIEMKRVE